MEIKLGEIPPTLNTAYKGVQNQFNKVIKNPAVVAAWASQNMNNMKGHVAKLGPAMVQAIPKQPAVGKVPIPL